MTVQAISVSTASARMALMSTNVCVPQDIQVCFDQKKCRLNELTSMLS